MQEAISRVNDNSGADHADIDTNRNPIENHNVELKSLSLALKRNTNELLNISDELISMRMFIQISTMADVLESLVMTIVEIKTEGAKGFCSDRAIDTAFLIENIQGLESNKLGLAPIFGSWVWREYYRYEMCTLAIDNESLWITLRVCKKNVF